MQDLQKTHDLLENMLKRRQKIRRATLEVKQDILLGGTKAETANITQLSRAKEMDSTAKKQKQYDQKQVGAED